MMTLQAFIKRHQLPTYFALTFAISWGGNVILVPLATGAPLVTWSLVLTAALWVVVAAIAVANGGQLSRQPLWRGGLERGRRWPHGHRPPRHRHWRGHGCLQIASAATAARVIRAINEEPPAALRYEN